MENNKIAVGLDIGTTKIVAMVGQKNEIENYNVFSNISYFKKIIFPSKEEKQKHSEYLKYHLKKNNFN